MVDKKLSQLTAGSAIADSDLFYSAQGGGQVKQPATALRTYLLGGSGIRTLLTAPLDLYISPSGDDTTGTGLTVGSPWQTIQKAFDYIIQTLDMGGQTVTVNLAAGTYVGAILVGPIVGSGGGGGVILLQANGAVTINDGGFGSFALLYTYSSFLYLNGPGPFTFTNTTTGGQTCIFADQNSLITIGQSVTAINFTGCASDIVQFLANRNGYIEIRGNTINTTGNLGVQFYSVNNAGIDVGAFFPTTVTWSSSTVGTAWAVADISSTIIIESGLTTSGTLTGKKYSSTNKSVIKTFGDQLPGSVRGTSDERIILTADLDLYVDPAGNDNNSGLIVGSPLLTIQRAFDYVMENVDFGNQNDVIIHLAAGTYSGAGRIFGPIPGSGTVYLTLAGAVTLNPSDYVVLYTDRVDLSVDGTGPLNVVANYSGGAALFEAENGGRLILYPSSGVTFTAGTDTDAFLLWGGKNSTVEIQASTTVTGNFNSFAYSAALSFVTIIGNVTFSGSVTAASAFAVALRNGAVEVDPSNVYTGTLTGKKYNATLNGIVNAFGATLPGTVAGTTGTGGQFL